MHKKKKKKLTLVWQENFKFLQQQKENFQNKTNSYNKKIS
jgi:hypothetical protein